MNKLLSRISKCLLGLSLAFGVGTLIGKAASRVDAGQAIYKTALFGSSYNSKGTNKYDQSWSSTNNGFTVDLVNFSNNNNGWDFVKCGRNGTASVGTITTHSVIDKAVTKVAITIDALTKSKINSITLSSSANGSSYTNLGTFDKSTGVKEVSVSLPTANQYYKLTFDCASGSSNGLITISRVDYYYESDVTATSLNVGAVSTYPGHTAEVSVSANPNGASLPTSLTYTSSNTSVFTVADGVVTGVAAGTATLTVANASNNSVYGTATVTVNSYPAINSRITVNGSNKYAMYAAYNSLNYSLNGVSGGSSGYGTVTSGISGDVDIGYKLEIVSGLYANTVAFKTDSNTYLGYNSNLTTTGNNYMHLIDEINERTSWIVTSDQVILAQTYGTATERHMLFNYNSGTNSRFSCYIPSSQNSSYPTPQFFEIIAQSLTGISVEGATLYPAHEKTLSVLPVPAAASLDGATYSFTSGTPSVATVDENGVVSALSAGSSVITITASVGGNNYSTTATIEVNNYPAANGLTLNNSYIIAGELEGVEYELTGIESEHNYGLVTAVSGSYTKNFVIRPVEGHYTNTVAFAAIDGSGYLKSTKSGSNLSLAANLALNTSWVVSYSNSTFSVISAETYGESTERHLLLNKNTTNGEPNPRIACYTGVSSTIVNINFLEAEVSVSDFTLSELEVTMYKSNTHTLEVTFTPNNTTDRTLSWSSSNTSVATVDNGVITGVAPGTATISASKEISGNTVTRTCSVTVLNNVATHAGTLLDPYTVNEAVNIAKGFFTEYSNGDPVNKTGAYVKGIVTNLSYKTTTSITFWVGDNASETSAATNGFEIYSPGSIMGKTVSERYSVVSEIEEDFALGNVIIACGDITLYQSTTAEFTSGSNVVLNNYIEASEFAKSFNDEITNGVCEADGSTDLDDLLDAWSLQDTAYSSLHETSKALFLAVNENGDENGNEIEHAVATYDYILKKYNNTETSTFNDFMGRVSENIVTLPAPYNNLVATMFGSNNDQMLIVIIISMVSLTSLTAFIYLKKRKQQ